MNRLLTCAALAALLCAGAACSSSAVQLPALHPADAPLRVVALDGSDWRSSEIGIQVSRDGETALVELTSLASRPAHNVLLELQFDPAYRAEVVRLGLALSSPTGLSLVATAQPGVAGIGLIMPAGQTTGPGPLAALRIVRTDVLARSSSAAPKLAFGTVADLAVVESGADLRFDWTYRNAGDCDQNSEVNVADLTPLSTRLFKRTDDGDADTTDVVLDADGNGEINPSDLSTIGQNYRGTVLSYNVYLTDGASPPVLTKLTSLDFPLGSANPHTRRAFSATIPKTLAGTGSLNFIVKATDGAAGAGVEALASNMAQIDLTPPVPAKFQVPPPGQQEPAAAGSLSPSLIRMPAIDGVADDGAPVIVYLNTAGTLTLAYYNTNAWVTADISAGVTYISPQAVWTGNAGAVLAFDVAAQKLMALPFDNLWVSSGPPGRAYDAPVADVITALDADYDAASSKLGVATAYTTTGGQHIVYSELAGGTWTNTDVYTGSGVLGEVLGGVSFRFDPQGGEPWCVYTVGTSNVDLATTTFMITTTLNLGRFNGTAWSVTPVTYPDSPLAVDLGFNAAGVARVAMNAARVYHLTIPTVGSYDLSILLDGTVGDYNGTTFVFPATQLIKSTATFGLVGGFPPTGFSITLHLATGASLAGPAGVCFNENNGVLEFDLAFTPTGGSLAPQTEFYSESGGSWSVSNFYTGSAGRNFSWDGGTAGLATAYLQGVTLDSSNLGQLTTGIASNLEYWSP